MKFKRICSKNMGPTDNIEISFEDSNLGTPKPIILVGENGTGKSTIISNIVDSFYEMARTVYDDAVEEEGSGYQYYKAIKLSEIKIGQKYMVCLAEFEDEGKDFQYIFKGGQLTYDEAKQVLNAQLSNIGHWEKGENVKRISGNEIEYQSVFNTNVICYFGPDRYEKPQWLGSKYYGESREFQHISINPRYSRQIVNRIAVKNVTDETLSWLLDVIVDSRTDISSHNGELQAVHSNINDVLKLGIARQNIERVMSEILGKEVYFGLNFRSAAGNRFNIKDKMNDEVIVPTLDSLSTGQSALFNMFATIIRYADNLNINKSIRIDEIKGVVIIDEIDLHLHTRLQREVLPKLLRLFPNIQFIITTHSPMFLLGMDEFYGKDNFSIFEMPEARKITVESFREFQKAYSYMTSTGKYQKEIKNAIQKHTQKTLLVTEGATDWRHIKSALQQLRETNYANLDIEFLEYNPINSKKEGLLKLDMSCSHLVTMCKEFAKVYQPRKIIFIADADDKTTKKELEGNESSYKFWGNNVYSMVLPVPKHRMQHYYTDDDLRISVEIEKIPRRVYLGSEFDETGISNDKKFMCLDRNNCGPGKINIIDGQSGKRVFEIEDNEKKNLALTKMDFAESIYEKREEFIDIDFTNFKLLFDVIIEIEQLPLM